MLLRRYCRAMMPPLLSPCYHTTLLRHMPLRRHTLLPCRRHTPHVDDAWRAAMMLLVFFSLDALRATSLFYIHAV